MAGAGHWYLKNGKLVTPQTPYAMPSVTTILDVRDKPELNAWRLRVGVAAAQKRQVESSERGTAIHQLVSDWITGKAVEATEPEHEERLHGYINWAEKYQPTDILSEQFVCSKAHGYAGSADIICRINGELWVIDLKTSRVLDASYGLQVRAYEQAWFEKTGEHARTACLQLTKENKSGYKFKEFNEPIEVFLACKTLLDWTRKHDTSPEFDGRYIRAKNATSA